MLPFMDFLNHAREPNCGIVPYIDKLNDNHSYFICQALRDIEPNEPLTISYGNLNNIHFVQKYGFTMFDEDQDLYNNVQGGYHFGDYQQIVYEEQLLK